MSKTYEENTKDFYNELNSECDPEKLLYIAKQGIFLDEPLLKYEKIKNHEYVVDISIMCKQFYEINNKKQYNRLKYFYKEIKIKKNNEITRNWDNDVIHEFYNIIVINKYLIDELLKEKNDKFLIELIIAKDYPNFFLFYLYNYAYIYTDVFILFYKYNYSKYEIPKLYFEVFKYFYSNVHKHLLDNFIDSNKHRYAKHIVSNLISYYENDINILNYCLDKVKKYNLTIDPCHYEFKLSFRHSLKYMNFYSNNLFNKNNLYLKCRDNYTSDFINSNFSDRGIKSRALSEVYKKDMLVKYNVNFNEIVDCEIISNNENNDKVIDSEDEDIDNNERIIHYNTKENLIKIIDPQYSGILSYKDKYYENYTNIYKFVFIKNYLRKYKEIDKILKDPNYVLSLKIDISNYNELLIIKLCYIASLIYNRANKFIIYVLMYYDCKRFYIKLRNNKIIFNGEKYPNSIYNIYNILTRTPHKVFNSYFINPESHYNEFF
ncbi:hypothetical protein H8356DRAFT_969070 [Neocallimastix lanati (nom. inval.)]|uniref:Uncharacterized protein n=1 Tax=Neocallimastix californiae TaxID=1754190 RepID=A0A1Y1YHE8_9FUNG|nr:hypothetical protein H8356DRAFT_1392216 [Neocallimastix sp. JGI-2020a]KAG4082806.1 hypothetical protein H8356DRAFT_969070 [Neocallimastix sp. JGI-2020a]ORX97303.1 hypothetical protein LY90DRAFT_520110 [Neocallimastix californiae]|eukprot:ORX97303.1 hypothetical protein LY90DRAFT_520110 [Neocallimastix californiae]